jgi:hypothetical protein
VKLYDFVFNEPQERQNECLSQNLRCTSLLPNTQPHPLLLPEKKKKNKLINCIPERVPSF